MSFQSVEYPFGVTGFYSAFDHRWGESDRFDGESHNFWEAVYVLSGEVEAVENENVYILGAGKLILHAPMEFHRIRSRGGTSPHFYVLSFSHAGSLPRILSEGCFALGRAEAGEYEEIFLRLFRWFHGDRTPAGGALPAAALTAFLLRLAETRLPEARPSPVGQASEYRRLVEVMREAVCENLALPEIAARACVSLGTMKLLFAHFSDTSPKRYYAHLRMREAERRLAAGETVAEVADHLGFSSPNYFSLFFKRGAGYSPGRLKKKGS